MSPDTHPVLGIFASSLGPGDAERASIMSQAGSFLARRGARLVALAESGVVPAPLISSARMAGSTVTVIADENYEPPVGMGGITLERLPTPEARLARMAELSNLYVALPGSLASAASLYLTWVRGGGGPGSKPVVFYDRNGAFKVLRGYAVDVIANSIKGYDRYVQFGDSIEDVWNKIVWLIDHKATAL